MLVGFLIELLVGMLCIIMGLLIWLKRRVSLIHDYHYQKVSEKDLPAYSRGIGLGLIVMGAGICMSAFLLLVKPSLWCDIPMLAGIVGGILILNKTQKKYNGSWFSGQM